MHKPHYIYITYGVKSPIKPHYIYITYGVKSPIINRKEKKYQWKVNNLLKYFSAHKPKFSIKDFFSKCDQILSFPHSLKKSLIENFIFCAVFTPYDYIKWYFPAS